MSTAILRVAVPTPVRRSFDYLVPQAIDASKILPGMRVRIPFGRKTRIGIVLARVTHSELELQRLKSVVEVLDQHPLLPAESLRLLDWSSQYYHHPIGEVVHAALPAPLRRGGTARLPSLRRWRLTPAGAGVGLEAVLRAPRQAELLRLIQSDPGGVTREQLKKLSGSWRGALNALVSKGWVEVTEDTPTQAQVAIVPQTWKPNTAQAAAIDSVCTSRSKGFQVYLLEGVTGSGKTEVYLGLIENFAIQGQQALLLIPEIGLTPQMVARLRKRLRLPVAVVHSGLSDHERLQSWLMARDGHASVVIGTRSAVLVPLKRLGIVIVDEEHDISYKQQDGFRYSARDLAIVRARQASVPVVLGSATPSLESLHNVASNRYRHLLLPQRAQGASTPDITIIDVRRRRMEDDLSDELLEWMESCIARGEQALLFLNRRGYAPTVMCHGCGWVADCGRCDAHMVYHHSAGRLCCHHCGSEHPVFTACPECGATHLRTLGVGTQRVAQSLSKHFPHARIARVDRDSTRRKGAMQAVLDGIHSGSIDILVGTQMLAKGHHFPNVTMVGVLDADSGLFGADFRACERMAQLIVQVAGRAGRADRPGRVVLQTHHPNHPMLRVLIERGYRLFADAALMEREEATFPPCACLALLRAEAPSREANIMFLEEARTLASSAMDGDMSVLGPVPAPMERRAGRYRAHLLVQSRQRATLHRLLGQWIPALEASRSGRRVRWSLDIDPQEML